MPNGLRPGRIGKVSGGWGISSGMLITELTTKLSGIPFTHELPLMREVVVDALRADSPDV
jgi:hypothetical protein